MKIAPTTTIHIKDFSAGEVTRASSYIINGIFDHYPDDRWYIQQRPGVNTFEDAADGGADAKGRGIYYWNKVSDKYICNNDTIYKTSYAGTQLSISAGTEKVYFFEVGDYLAIIDSENNEGWVINSATPTVIAQITDIHFPPEQTPALTLANGGVAHNGILFVYTTDGDIYECDVEDPTAWEALSFINSEVEQDGGIFLARHHEHIVAVGNRSMEFFYDNPSPPATGSTLLPRKDLYYEIGSIHEHTFWTEGDILFFVAQTPSGGVEVHALENFTPNKVSTPDIDTFLGSALITDGLNAFGSGFRIGGRIYYVLTLFNLISTVVPVTTLVYNAKSQTWTFWELEHAGIDDCPIHDWAKQTTERTGEGILSNGDLITIADDFNPQDTTGSSRVFEVDVFEPDVFTATGATGLNINWEVVFGTTNGGISKRKFQSRCQVIGTPTVTAQTATIQWSDESDNNWNAGKTIELSDPDASIRRMGKFYYRNYRFLSGGDEQYRLEALETEET